MRPAEPKKMLPARPGWGPQNDTGNDRNRMETFRFLAFIVLLGILTKTIYDLKIRRRIMKSEPLGDEGGDVLSKILCTK